MDKKSYTGAIIGIGGLGCPALLSLLEAWPTNLDLSLKLFDGDNVALSNLNRQIIFTTKDIGKNKAAVAKDYINNSQTLNPRISPIEVVAQTLAVSDIKDSLSNCDFILDCTDDVNFKLALNNYSKAENKLLIYAGAQGFHGVVLGIRECGPCLKCAFGDFSFIDACELGESCQTGGILGPIAGITALTQVEELFKNLFEIDHKNELILISKIGSLRRVAISKDPNCPNACTYYPRKVIDLRSFNCPETFLYAKLGLEKLGLEQSVEILLKNNEDMNNVLKSLKEEGYQNSRSLACPDLGISKIVVPI